MKQQEIYVVSTLDGTLQPSLFYKVDGEKKRPLLVGLHTWSFDRFNQVQNMLPYAEKNYFHLLRCYFLNGAEYAKPCDEDGIHFDAKSHVRLGNAVAEYVEKYIMREGKSNEAES